MTGPARLESGEIATQEFSAAGFRTYALVEGRLDGFPAIFLHGLPGASFLWRPLVGQLPRTVRCIAPDLPGWGKSQSSFAGPVPALSPELLRNWFAGLLRAQQVERFDLMVHGTAAAMAGVLITAAPDSVRRLGLFNPQWSTESRGMNFARLFKSPRWNESRIAGFLERADLSDGNRPGGWAEPFKALLLRDGNPRLMLESDSVLKRFAADLERHADVITRHKGLKFVVWGRAGMIADQQWRAVLNAANGWKEYNLNTGGYSTLEAPEESVSILTEHLTD